MATWRAEVKRRVRDPSQAVTNFRTEWAMREGGIKEMGFLVSPNSEVKKCLSSHLCTLACGHSTQRLCRSLSYR